MATSAPSKTAAPVPAQRAKRERKAPVTVDLNAISVETADDLPSLARAGDGFIEHLTPIVKRAITENAVLSVTVPNEASDRTQSAIRQIVAKMNKGARVRPIKLDGNRTKVYFKVTEKRAKKPNSTK